MTKSELIASLAADHPHLTTHDIEMVVSTIFGEIILSLSQGDRVELRGFGIFGIRLRSSLTSRNPQTGSPVPVRYRSVPYFKSGKDLRIRVDSGSAIAG